MVARLIKLTEEEHKYLALFLNRTNLKGDEAAMFMTVADKINNAETVALTTDSKEG